MFSVGATREPGSPEAAPMSAAELGALQRRIKMQQLLRSQVGMSGSKQGLDTMNELALGRETLGGLR